jgi:signal transduction histidine kinase
MRNRIVGTYVVLIVIALVGLAVPLAVTIAAGRSEQMFRDRFVDAAQFASLADPALRTGETESLSNDMRRYYDLYGITAAVTDRDGAIVAFAGDKSLVDATSSLDLIEQALAGLSAGGAETIWPWRPGPVGIAVPVRSGGETIGAVVTFSPSDTTRSDILQAWAVVGAVVLCGGGIFVTVAVGLTRWVLRPVAELDDAAHRIGAGETLASPLSAELGPPELRRLTHSFNDMAVSVMDLLNRQREFTAQASHQMRNPLTALILRVEALGEFIHDAAGQAEHRLAMDETDRLGRILDGLLALARAERGNVTAEVVDAAATAAERVNAWRQVAARREISLLLSGESRANVLAVPTAVGQTLDALIDNALKFAGRAATVGVRVDQTGDLVEIHVEDDGPGLTHDELRRASQRFWRAADVQNLDGCGLGLTIAAVLAEASGGQLDLFPVRPHGLHARVSFPASPEPLPAQRFASR